MAQGDVPTQQQTVGLADQWRGWMADPHNRAALMQFGIALSQPIAAGQNIGGQIGSAFGQAGEASDRVTAEQQKEQELASKQDLRTAQAESAAQRAEAAGARSGAAADRLTFQRERLSADQERNVLRANVSLRGMHDKYLQGIRTQNQKISHNNELMGTNTPLIPEPTFEKWLSVNPSLTPLLGGGGAGPDVGSARIPVETPDDVRKLPSGTPYVTPDGRTGTAP
jgi:hypothetical protein